MAGALEREAHFIVTTGGLGPTQDDLTTTAVCEALGLGLEVEPTALRWVKEKYAALALQGYVDSPDMTPARVKMAPLTNPVGVAPGVLARRGSSVLVILPGVPAELPAVFKDVLRPTLMDVLGVCSFAKWQVTVECDDRIGPGICATSRPRPICQCMSSLVLSVLVQISPSL